MAKINSLSVDIELLDTEIEDMTDIAIEDVSDITHNSALIHGYLDIEEVSTTKTVEVHFEYTDDPDFESNIRVTPGKEFCEAGVYEWTEQITGLSPESEYYARPVAVIYKADLSHGYDTLGYIEQRWSRQGFGRVEFMREGCIKQFTMD